MSLNIAAAKAKYMLDLAGMTNSDLLDTFKDSVERPYSSWELVAIRTELLARMS